jgi:hypothetical protein
LNTDNEIASRGLHNAEVRASLMDWVSSFSDIAVDRYTEVPGSNRVLVSDVLNEVYCGDPRSLQNIKRNCTHFLYHNAIYMPFPCNTP